MSLHIRADVIVHATEDRSKIAGSLVDLLGVQPEALESRSGEGHYRNAITTLSATLRKAEARGALERLRGALSGADLDRIMDTLESRTDGSTLYMRLDKQEMVSGRIRLNDSGTVRFRITVPAYGGRTGDAFAQLLGRD